MFWGENRGKWKGQQSPGIELRIPDLCSQYSMYHKTANISYKKTIAQQLLHSSAQLLYVHLHNSSRLYSGWLTLHILWLQVLIWNKFLHTIPGAVSNQCMNMCNVWFCRCYLSHKATKLVMVGVPLIVKKPQMEMRRLLWHVQNLIKFLFLKVTNSIICTTTKAWNNHVVCCDELS